MFSGIIQGIGSLLDSNNNEYKISTKLDLSDSKLGLPFVVMEFV